MLSEFDKQLLNAIQSDLPLDRRPFAVVADRLATDENTVIERLRYLKEHAYIRRIGPFFDSESLGYVGTLVALSVEPDQLTRIAEAVNVFSGVTHNYEREGRYNLWFTLLSPDKATQNKILASIEKMPGVNRLMSLPATKKYKVSVQFKLE
jgi:DNA-binding Lrp family transcriptional regulator